MKQITNHIMMIRPANFGFNEQTAVNNAFQSRGEINDMQSLKKAAIDEFDHMVALLRSHGVDVTVVADTAVVTDTAVLTETAPLTATN